MKAGMLSSELGDKKHLCQEQREALLTEHLPLVRYIAKRIHQRLPHHVPLDDLIQAGALGLIQAIDRYDPNRKAQLVSYAKFRIRGAILDSLRDVDWGPRSLRFHARQIEEGKSRLREKLLRAPDDEEVALELGFELLEYQRLLANIRRLEIGTLLMESSVESEDHAHEKTIPTSHDQDPFHLCMQTEHREVIADAISELSERGRQVVSLYYFQDLTMREVGRTLGVGESRVSQIHSESLLALRASLFPRLGAGAL